MARFAHDHFNFALAVQEPGPAEAELGRNPRETLLRFLHSLSGDAPAGTAKYLFEQKRPGTSILEGMPFPPGVPAWFGEAGLECDEGEFQRTGFHAALNWYRNMDRDWNELTAIGSAGIRQPACFMGGRRDPTVSYAPFDDMIRAVPNLRRIVFLSGCGHWVAQERTDDLNRELLAFLKQDVVESRTRGRLEPVVRGDRRHPAVDQSDQEVCYRIRRPLDP